MAVSARKYLLFGREPALVLNAAGAVLALLSQVLFHLSADQQGAINMILAAAVGLAVHQAVTDGGSALVLGLIKAGVVGALAFHFNIDPDTQVLLYGATAAILGAYTRTQVIAPAPADPTD